MQQIILTLLADGDKEIVKEPMAMSKWAEMTVSFVPRVEAFTEWTPDQDTQPSTSPPRRVIKTHAPFQLRPWSEQAGAKVVVVSRNPGDACVSMYHHSLDIPAFRYFASFSHFWNALYKRGLVEHGCFWDWHSGWYNYMTGAGAGAGAGSGSVLWVKFEDIKKDPEGQIRRIAEYCCIPASDEVIRKTVEASSFKNMKATADAINSDKAKKGIKFKKNHIRKGESGKWRKTFKDESEGFLKFHQIKCDQLGLPEDLFPLE